MPTFTRRRRCSSCSLRASAIPCRECCTAPATRRTGSSPRSSTGRYLLSWASTKWGQTPFFRKNGVCPHFLMQVWFLQKLAAVGGFDAHFGDRQVAHDLKLHFSARRARAPDPAPEVGEASRPAVGDFHHHVADLHAGALGRAAGR